MEETLKKKKEAKVVIKNRWTGDVIYSSEKKTIKKAVIEAVSKKADLREADLREANLYRADLREANLYRADLREADLYRANLSEADLYGADLCEADLCEADLSEANLYEANFLGKGGSTKIKKNQVDDFFKALGIIVIK